MSVIVGGGGGGNYGVDPHYDDVDLLIDGSATSSTVVTDIIGSRVFTASAGGALVNSDAFLWGDIGEAMQLNGLGYFQESAPDAYYSFLHDGTSDWTMEGWIYNTKDGGWQTLFTTNDFGTGVGCMVAIHPSGWFFLRIGKGGSSSDMFSSASFTNAVWQHFAVTCHGSGGSYTGYIDGVEVFDYTGITGHSAAIAGVSATLAGRGNDIDAINGTMQGMRITKVDRYPSAFTPSVGPWPGSSGGGSPRTSIMSRGVI